ERAEPVRTTGGADRDALDDRSDATETRSEDDPCLLGLGPLEPWRKSSLVHRLARRDEPEDDIAVHPPEVLAIEDVGGVQIVDLGRDLGGDPRRVERLNPTDPGASGRQRLPEAPDVVA